jgi:uncharacterized tellurite resistance protein B-like protein
MLNYLKKILYVPQNDNKGTFNNKPGETSETKKLEAATCTLFIEVAKADNNFSEEERDKIISIMNTTFELEPDCINDLIELAEKRLEADDSIYDFTNIINNNFTNEQKFELLKNLWRLIYTDDKLDIYEEHMIKKIGGLINMGHEDIIGTKLLVKEEMKK